MPPEGGIFFDRVTLIRLTRKSNLTTGLRFPYPHPYRYTLHPLALLLHADSGEHHRQQDQRPFA
jgi:hypothetical protein